MTMRDITMVEIYGVKLAIIDVVKETELSVAAMKKQKAKYEEALQCPVAYEVALNSVSMRNALVKNGVPFVDLPFFAPALADALGTGSIDAGECVDNRTYIYTTKNVYDTRQKLYEIEEILVDKAFLRISKSVVVNLMKIKALKPAMNGRFSAVLSNGEEVIISR